VEREDVLHIEAEGGEDTVETLKAEGTAGVEEVGDVGLLKANLTGELSASEVATLNAAEKFEPEKFMQVGEIHAGNISLCNFIAYAQISNC